MGKYEAFRAILFLALMLLVSSTVLFVYVHQLSHTALSYTTSYLEEICGHGVENVSEKILTYRTNLKEIAELIRMADITELQSALALTKLKKNSLQMKELYLIDEEGITYSSDGIICDQNRSAFVRAVVRERRDYFSRPDEEIIWYNWTNCIQIAFPIAPLILGGKKIVGLCGEYPFAKIGDGLQQNFFGEKGISLLIDRYGNILAQKALLEHHAANSNFFHSLTSKYHIEYSSHKDFIKALRSGDPVNLRYTKRGIEYICVARPLPFFALTMVTTVPVSVANRQYTQMLHLTLLTVLLVGGFILGLVVWIYRVRRRAFTLNLEKNTAEQISRSKSAFLSSMSHEIRTPLNAVIGFTELLQQDETIKGKSKEYLRKIGASSHFLLSLINDILDMSRIDSGKMELENIPFSLKPMLANIKSIIEMQAKQRGIHFRIECLTGQQELTGDAMRTQQIMINILGNALKFTPKDGLILFRIETLEETEEEVVLRFFIKDTGCGMTPEFLSKVFIPFMQEYNGNTKKHQGTGLGLAICKELAHLIGGSISVESEVGEGTAFTVELPFRKQQPGAVPASREDTPQSRTAQEIWETADWSGVTALIAEDNELNMEILETLLSMRGIQTLRASNGLEAVEIFTTVSSDLDIILMDMQMPVMNGIEASDAIRRSPFPNARTIPILAVTANAFSTDVELVKAHGMNAHIPKPIDPNALFEKMYAVLFAREKSGKSEGEEPAGKKPV